MMNFNKLSRLAFLTGASFLFTGALTAAPAATPVVAPTLPAATPAATPATKTTATSSARLVENKAIARVSPTEGNQVKGLVTFEKLDGGGVLIVADFEGLTPGLHGFHVHEHGDCSSKDGSSAGGHYNPTNKKHGGPDDAERHAGDFGNVKADSSGKAHYERTDTVIDLDGVNTIIGKSIVIHADPDDLKTDPSGNSGKRIGCGLIEAFR